MGLGATWKLVLGVVFVLLVSFLHQGIIGGIRDLYVYLKSRSNREAVQEGAASAEQGINKAHSEKPHPVMPLEPRHPVPKEYTGPILQTTGLTKHYGGVLANTDINFTVNEGELCGIIGPNGAGKSTFFKMLTCEVHPTSGTIRFEGKDITGMNVVDVCQLGLTKSYQVNQLFNRLTVRQNLTIAALAELRGKFRLDLFANMSKNKALNEQVEHTLDLISLTHRLDTPVSQLAYGEKRRLEVGLALATSPTLLLLDEPLAGMSPQERADTVELLKSIAKDRTMIVIDHDMTSLFELAERITMLQEGRILADGTPEEIKNNALVQEAYLGGMHGVTES